MADNLITYDSSNERKKDSGIAVSSGQISTSNSVASAAVQGVTTSAGAGDSGKVVKLNGSGKIDSTMLSSTTADIIVVQDQKAANTAGGTFTSGAWRTRDINTEVVDTGNHCSISSNQITLAAGTYECIIRAPAYQVDNHRCKLYNITDSSDVLLGESARTSATVGSISHSQITGRFVLAAQKTLEIQHFCSASSATQGFGFPVNDGSVEIYTTAFFRKVA